MKRRRIKYQIGIGGKEEFKESQRFFFGKEPELYFIQQ